MDQTKSILIIGEPGSTKTTFLAQFVTITRKGKGSVKFWKNPENIQPIEHAMKKLRSGEETESTPATDNLIINLPISVKGADMEMVCPDYGGEQINEILNLREVNNHWLELISKSSSWILFIRPQKLEFTFDLSNKTISEHNENVKDQEPPEFKISDQSRIIELIQMMLHVKKISYQKPINAPKLTIALTCWDEIEEKTTPGQFLKKTLPLLSQFLEENWNKESLNILGVSAQGFRLNTQDNKDKYLDEGPDKFAYVVLENSTEHIMDLTVLVQEAI